MEKITSQVLREAKGAHWGEKIQGLQENNVITGEAIKTLGLRYKSKLKPHIDTLCTKLTSTT